MERQLKSYIDRCSAGIANLSERLGPHGYVIYGVFSFTLYFLGSLSIRLNPGVDWSICVLIRGLVTFILTSVISQSYGGDLTFKISKDFAITSVRNFLISSQQVFFYFVVKMVPVKIVWVINNANPIFMNLISACIMKTPLTGNDFFFLLVSFLGINIITAPNFILNMLRSLLPHANDVKSTQSQIDEAPLMDGNQTIISLMFLGSVSIWCLAVIIGKFSKSATSLSTNNNLGLQLALFAGITLINRADAVKIPTPTEWMIIIFGVALPTFLCQMLFVQGTIVAKNQGIFALTNYVPVFHSYIFEIFFEGKTPCAFEIFGIALAFYGLYKVLMKPAAATAKKEQLLELEQDFIADKTRYSGETESCSLPTIIHK